MPTWRVSQQVSRVSKPARRNRRPNPHRFIWRGVRPTSTLSRWRKPPRDDLGIVLVSKSPPRIDGTREHPRTLFPTVIEIASPRDLFAQRGLGALSSVAAAAP